MAAKLCAQCAQFCKGKTALQPRCWVGRRMQGRPAEGSKSLPLCAGRKGCFSRHAEPALFGSSPPFTPLAVLLKQNRRAAPLLSRTSDAGAPGLGEQVPSPRHRREGMLFPGALNTTSNSPRCVGQHLGKVQNEPPALPPPIQVRRDIFPGRRTLPPGCRLGGAKSSPSAQKRRSIAPRVGHFQTHICAIHKGQAATGRLALVFATPAGLQ